MCIKKNDIRSIVSASCVICLAPSLGIGPSAHRKAECGSFVWINNV
jgi:hypothetical protein